MPIELTGDAKRETRGMKTRVVYRLNMAPSPAWLKLFQDAKGVQVADCPRGLFQFDRDSVVCEFLGQREPETLSTLQIYIADTNRHVESLLARRRAATDPKLRRRQIEAKKRQTLMLGREMFGDGPEPGEE
jgi:hypothetical protein